MTAEENAMTSEEYEASLDAAEHDIQAGKLDEAEAKLAALRQYKPLRAKLSLLTGLCRYARTKKPDDFFNEIRGKFTTMYDYPEGQQRLETCIKIFAEKKNVLDEQRFRVILQTVQGDFRFYETLNRLIAGRKNVFEIERDIFYSLYCATDILSAFLQSLFLKKTYPGVAFSDRPWLKNEQNMGYLAEELASQDAAPFIVILDEKDQGTCQIALRNLQALGKETYSILPLASGRFRLQDGQGRTLSTAKDWVSLLDRVLQRRKKDRLAYVIANDFITEELSRTPEIAKNFQRIIGHEDPCSRRNLMLSWYGDYLSYISRVYLEDCHKLIAAPAKKRFSIVIPARNAAGTLRHTLRTCLEQSYQGPYEIIVSDNSTGQNLGVYELCKELDDPRIVYLKTPRNLYLTKSFEYAYLHTSGEYVFSIGADDGLLPWALDLLDLVARSNPEEPIIQWNRGSYAWPGFNGGQQHELSIPQEYTFGSMDIYYQPANEYWADIFETPEKMYLLPMLYIDSCCKRSYFRTLLKKTGRLLDGSSQDIFTGVANLLINERILNIGYPLVIAGMSPNSIGLASNLPRETNAELDRILQLFQREGNVGGFFATYDEALVPRIGSDIGSFYLSIMRATSLGLITREQLESLPWQKIFTDVVSDRLDVRDVDFDRKLQEMRYAAMQHGEEFLDWVDKAIYKPMMTPDYLPEPSSEKESTPPKRTYEEGLDDEGVRRVDASKYGVTNIYEAVQLFVKLMKEYSLPPEGKKSKDGWQVSPAGPVQEAASPGTADA